MTTEAIRNEPLAADEHVPLPLRGDTFLGVFQAIGEDLGFNANWLRIPFAALLLWNPAAILGAYAFLGCVVALTRWFFPVSERNRTRKPSAEAAPESVSANEAEEDLRIAA
jgi:hypothetical protein